VNGTGDPGIGKEIWAINVRNTVPVSIKEI
jgi:hypothetical protein